MRRVFFTGAGGVGKTSVLVSLEKKLTDRGIKFHTFLSVSREFFKSKGITTEQAGLERREADRLTFQSDLFEFYCQRLKDAYATARATNAQVFLSDRSPHDHLAYLVYSSPNLLTFDQLYNLRFRATEVFNNIGEDGVDPCSVFHFPCVAPWMTDTVLRDGMRHAPPGKNFMVNALIETLSADLYSSHLRQRILSDITTVEERSEFVLQSILTDLTTEM